MVRDLTHRLTALGRAHELVCPIPGQPNNSAALLGDLLTVLLTPYEDTGTFSERVRVSVPKMGVCEASATTLALVVHELATNSLKYGALSAASGALDVSCTADGDEVIVVWAERGGPPETSTRAGRPGNAAEFCRRDPSHPRPRRHRPNWCPPPQLCHPARRLDHDPAIDSARPPVTLHARRVPPPAPAPPPPPGGGPPPPHRARSRNRAATL